MPRIHAYRRPFTVALAPVQLRAVCLAGVLLLYGIVLPGIDVPAVAQEKPLSERIDQAIAAAHLGPQAPLTKDSEFLRRVYLDLVGRIPSQAELEEFLSSDSPQKRYEWIDRLLASDECNDHLAVVFDVMLMERRPDKYVTTDEWRRYLRQSLAANKPFNELAGEILAASGEEGPERPAAKFLLDREVEGNAITRDVSRMFLGRDIQCSQCHDHPLVSDYSQAEYYGILSFLNRCFRFEKTTEDKQQVSSIGERADGDVSFASVFEPGTPKVTALPALPNGLAYDQEPLLAEDEAYLVAPDKNVRPCHDIVVASNWQSMQSPVAASCFELISPIDCGGS